MSTTLAGVPRVKAKRRLRAKPLEPTAKREPEIKKQKITPDVESMLDALDNGWRKKK